MTESRDKRFLVEASVTYTVAFPVYAESLEEVEEFLEGEDDNPPSIHEYEWMLPRYFEAEEIYEVDEDNRRIGVVGEEGE